MYSAQHFLKFETHSSVFGGIRVYSAGECIRGEHSSRCPAGGVGPDPIHPMDATGEELCNALGAAAPGDRCELHVWYRRCDAGQQLARVGFGSAPGSGESEKVDEDPLGQWSALDDGVIRHAATRSREDAGEEAHEDRLETEHDPQR